MVNKVCIDRILNDANIRQKIVDGEITKKQVEEIVNTFDQMKDKPNFIKNAKNYRRAQAENAAYGALQKATTIQRRVELNKFAVESKLIEENHPNKIFESIAESPDFVLEGGKFSITKVTNALQGKHRQAMTNAMGKNERFALDSVIHRDIAIAMDNINKGKSISKFAPEVQELAHSFRKLNKYVVNELEAGGVVLRERSDYIFRQSHDVTKISGTAKDDWVDFIYNKLDHEKTFGEVVDSAKQREILSQIHDDITSGKHGSGIGDLGRKRSLHFKDGANFFDYHERFGEGTMLEAFQRSLDVAARTEAMYKLLGPDAEATWKNLEKTVGERVKELHGQKAYNDFMNTNIGGQKNFRDNIAENLFGHKNHPAKGLAAKVLEVAQAVTATAKLQWAGFSTVTDFAITTSNYMAKTGVNAFKAQSDFLSKYTKSFTPTQTKKFGKLLGMSFDIDMADRYGLFEGASGSLKKFTRFAMKMTALNATTRINRTTGAMLFSSHLADISHLKFSEINPRMQAELKNFRMLEKDWPVLQKAIAEADGLRLMVPEKIADRELQTKFLTFLTHNAETSSPQTGIRTRANAFQGLSANTVQGQVARALLQFKSFPLQIGRVIKEISLANPDAKARTMSQGLRDMGNLSMFGQLMAGGFIAAGVGLMARDLAKGKTPRDMSKYENVLEALNRGVMPIYFQFLIDAAKGDYTNFGRSVTKDVAGPVFGQIDDVFQLISAAAKGQKVLKKSINLGKKNIPLISNPIIEPLLNKAFMSNLYEYADPGSSARINRRMREQGQEFIHPFFEP